MAKIDDGVIDYDEFLIASQLPDSTFAKNMFWVFDMNEDGAINFREFLIGLATFSNETLDKQISAAFKLLDPESTGEVTKDQLCHLLKDVAKVYQPVFIEISDEALEHLVAQTFEDLEVEVLDLERFKKMIYAKPSMLKWFQIDLNKIAFDARKAR